MNLPARQQHCICSAPRPSPLRPGTATSRRVFEVPHQAATDGALAATASGQAATDGGIGRRGCRHSAGTAHACDGGAGASVGQAASTAAGAAADGRLPSETAGRHGQRPFFLGGQLIHDLGVLAVSLKWRALRGALIPL
eukprot:CAMPEP_0179223426 /NCGR_PEP_ID=MMETSP0797-20121207/7232_1 /TAXON_ID=47934 /ORGANISM="Dinophysis acuminata, Strain DAEP01" /LENGTH=138 /DNA_ID=CAMNT_0020930303 /DNA_START=229 /DNA_END=643 /DNA_ORIENTATION=+